jgi:hypothetical protein
VYVVPMISEPSSVHKTSKESSSVKPNLFFRSMQDGGEHADVREMQNRSKGSTYRKCLNQVRGDNKLSSTLVFDNRV